MSNFHGKQDNSLYHQHKRLVELSSAKNPFQDDFIVDAQPQGPSISLLAGIATGTGTVEEEELWESTFASLPSAQEQLALYRSSIESPEAFPSSLLDRGLALLDKMPSLPDDFGQEETSPFNFSEEAVIEEAVIEEVAISLLGEPEEQEVSRTPARSTSPIYFWGGLTAVACAALFMLLQSPFYSSSTQTPIYKLPPYQVNVKGGVQTALPHSPENLSVSLWIRSESASIEEASSSFHPQTGMELRFSYNLQLKESLYVSIFLSDQKGKVTQLYPSQEEQPTPLKQGVRQYLKGGVLVEKGSTSERIYACVSTKPFTSLKVFKAFREQLKSVKIETLHRLPWSCLYQRSWLLTAHSKKINNK